MSPTVFRLFVVGLLFSIDGNTFGEHGVIAFLDYTVAAFFTCRAAYLMISGKDKDYENSRS